MIRWKRQFHSLLLVQLLVGIAHGMYIPLLAGQLATFKLTSDELIRWTGIAFSGNFLAMMLVMPFLGKLGDRIGMKPIMIWSGIGMTVVTAIMGWTEQPQALATLRVLQGCFTGILPFTMMLIVTGAPKDRVGASVGILQMTSEAGSVLGPLIGSAVILLIKPELSFPIMSAFILAGAIVVMLRVQEPEHKPQSAERTNLLQDLANIWRNKPFPNILISAFCINFCLVGTSPMLVYYIEKSSDTWWPAGISAGFALAVTSVAVILFSPLLGRVADRIGPLPLLKAACLFAIVLSIFQAVTTSYTIIIVCRFLMGICTAAMMPNIQIQIRNYLTLGMESRTFAITNAWSFLGCLAGPAAAGIIVAAFGIESWFLTIALVFLISCWQAFRIGALSLKLKTVLQ